MNLSIVVFIHKLLLASECYLSEFDSSCLSKDSGLNYKYYFKIKQPLSKRTAMHRGSAIDFLGQGSNKKPEENV